MVSDGKCVSLCVTTILRTRISPFLRSIWQSDVGDDLLFHLFLL